MKVFSSGPLKFTQDLPHLSAELSQQVLKEVAHRLSGKRKWCPNETLEQIILNKYTVLQLKGVQTEPLPETFH